MYTFPRYLCQLQQKLIVPNQIGDNIGAYSKSSMYSERALEIFFPRSYIVRTAKTSTCAVTWLNSTENQVVELFESRNRFHSVYTYVCNLKTFATSKSVPRVWFSCIILILTRMDCSLCACVYNNRRKESRMNRYIIVATPSLRIQWVKRTTTCKCM